MTTDIHDLDRYIGHYVTISEGTEGMAGWVIDVVDDIEYRPHPTRVVLLDYGYGFPVGERTEIALAVEPPRGDPKPRGVANPIEAMHQAAHDGTDCPGEGSCPVAVQSYRALRALRVWRMKQSDLYWKHRWVDKADALASDPHSVSEILLDARDEGAPPHILDAIEKIAARNSQASPTVPDSDPWASEGSSCRT